MVDVTIGAWFSVATGWHTCMLPRGSPVNVATSTPASQMVPCFDKAINSAWVCTNLNKLSTSVRGRPNKCIKATTTAARGGLQGEEKAKLGGQAGKVDTHRIAANYGKADEVKLVLGFYPDRVGATHPAQLLTVCPW